MDPQNVLNSKGFIIEMIKTGTNANFLLKNTLKTDAVFTIYNGAKLGDATVARAPPLLCHPRNL